MTSICALIPSMTRFVCSCSFCWWSASSSPVSYTQLDAIKYGADGTGGTSGIVAAEDPFATLDEMFEALDRARTDFAK